MGSGQFTHLHVHTEFSIQDAMCKIGPLVKKAKALGMTAIASTDHGNMFSLIQFYLAAKEAGIKPILGCEAYICPEGQSFRPTSTDRHNRHIVLLCKNITGYKNLVKIISDASINGFYYDPRTDFSILRKYHEGLICLTACLGGDVPRDMMNYGIEAAEAKLNTYIDIFGKDNVYLELQDNGIQEQYVLNELLVKLSKKTGVPLVATNDVHYIEPADAKYHDALMAIKAKTTISSKHRQIYGTNELYLKSPEKMWGCGLPEEAIENTNIIAERCNVEFEMGKFYLPAFDQPADFASSEEYLRYLAFNGIAERYPDYHERKQFYDDRLNYELGVVSRMGYVNYFLIVWDYVYYAASIGAIPSPGRGSGAGSILAYSLYITHVDPIRHNLIFERFLNPDRFSPPDIDWDIQDDMRQQLIEYMVRRYGRDHICQIITFGTYAARNAVRASARALGLPYSVGDEVAKAIPALAKMTIDKAMEINQDLKKWYTTDPERKELLDLSMAIEGLPSHPSKHAAGILITPGPTTDYAPVWKLDDGIVAQYDMNMLEAIGLLKADLLGLKTLTVISNALKGIYKNYGVRISNQDLFRMIDDPNSYRLIMQGQTQGIFQLEGPGMTATAKEMQPSNIDEVTALIALYRPGPMDYIPEYIANKRNPERIKLRFESLREILRETYGIIVYQEQVMFASQILAGYPMSAADELRKGIGKKKRKIIDEHRNYIIHGREAHDKYVAIPGAMSRGYNEQQLNEWYDDIEKFGEYSFNKSHAAAYAYLSAWTSNLKFYYPTEFMAALLTSCTGDFDKIPFYVQHCKAVLGIEILPPSINESMETFIPLPGNKIRFSLVAAKDVGFNGVMQIIHEREARGPFHNFSDFVYRCIGGDVGTSEVEGLIRCGAFDEFGLRRSQLLSIMFDSCDTAKKLNNNLNNRPQARLFPGVIETFDEAPDLFELPTKTKLKVERQTVGVYLSGHPLDSVKSQIARKSNVSSSKFAQDVDEDGIPTGTYGVTPEQRVRVVGILGNVKEILTKKKDPMAFATLEDTEGSIGLVFFPSIFANEKQRIVNGAIVCVSGRVSYRNDEPPTILVERFESLDGKLMKKLYIRVNDLQRDSGTILEIVKTPGCHGDIPVFVCVNNAVLLLNDRLWVNNQGLESLVYCGLRTTIKEE